MEDRKSNRGLYIIIIVLVAVICLLVGFVFGSGLLSSDGNNNSSINENNKEENDDIEDKEKEDEIVSISEVEGSSLFEKVKVYNDYFTRDYSSDGLKNADNNRILYFLAYEFGGFDVYRDAGFSTNDLQKMANEYLPDDVKISYTDILFLGYETATLFYLGQNGKYTYNTNLGIGGPGGMIMEEFYIDGSYNKTKDIYTINTKLLYNQWCPDVCGVGHGSFYSDSDLENVIYPNTVDNYMSFDSVYEIVKDKLPITSYTFEKNSSGNYVLTSVVVK